MMNLHSSKRVPLVFLAAAFCFFISDTVAQQRLAAAKPAPKIINIVNFIRLLEPRDTAITQDVLYQTVVKQIAQLKKYHLGGTFLLQYDALIDKRYQQLLKSLPKGSFEVGAWWELPQPLIEKAGLKWRGRYPWDWHADVGFSTGYTPAEREKIIDVYMADFKEIFGYYPRSVASWFIDAHTLKYMCDKYKIVASANCKDQYGTDGYTLWGGYWNQAYYPSKINSYMPAQNAANQIPVPIFRMLGSDPIRQYDTGLNSARQGVITLEPVYPKAGGSEEWINWFFDTFSNAPSLGFNYTQAGQENSFTWAEMQKGLELQMPIIEKLRNEGKVRVETMEQSGLWFRKTYPVTPPTSFTVTKDIKGSDQKTIWYNSRFYRMNIMWENGRLRIRDIHLFNEKIADKYTTEVVTGNECQFFTLPVVDGYLWSKAGDLAGLELKAVVNGRETALRGGNPTFTHPDDKSVLISWPLNSGGTFKIRLGEKTASMQLISKKPVNWYFGLHVTKAAKLPVVSNSSTKVFYEFDGHKYQLQVLNGKIAKGDHTNVYMIYPLQHTIRLNMSDAD
jgi:hypothetical protein